MTLAPGGDKLLRFASLSIATAADSKLDLADNDMILDYPTGGPDPQAQVQSWVNAARNGGAWDGVGITSESARARTDGATTLAVMSGDDYFSIHGIGATFDGQAIDSSTVLVKYTYYGDTDFSGQVDFDDYVRVDGGFNSGLSGWVNGDFDAGGVVDFDDYVLIDLAFNAQSGTLRRAQDYLDGGDRSLDGMDAPALRAVVQHFDQFGIDYATHFLAAVPEPTGCLVPLLGGLVAARRGRRR
jgi:hypothetical protein